MSDHWDIYFATVDEHFASIVLDMDIWKEVNHSEFSYPMALKIVIKNPADTGVPVDDEAELINALEDRIINEVAGIGHNVGRVTRNGIRDVYFYFNKPFDMHSLAAPIFSEHGYYIETYPLEEKEPWEIYFGFLYPNGYEFQHMGNRSVLDSLRNSGDSLEEPRRVDHWIEFSDEHNKDAFIDRIKTLNFDIEGERRTGDGVTIQIYRVDRVDPQSINNLTDMFVDLDEEFGCRYDGWETQVIK